MQQGFPNHRPGQTFGSWPLQSAGAATGVPQDTQPAAPLVWGGYLVDPVYSAHYQWGMLDGVYQGYVRRRLISPSTTNNPAPATVQTQIAQAEPEPASLSTQTLYKLSASARVRHLEQVIKAAIRTRPDQRAMPNQIYDYMQEHHGELIEFYTQKSKLKEVNAYQKRVLGCLSHSGMFVKDPPGRLGFGFWKIRGPLLPETCSLISRQSPAEAIITWYNQTAPDFTTAATEASTTQVSEADSAQSTETGSQDLRLPVDPAHIPWGGYDPGLFTRLWASHPPGYQPGFSQGYLAGLCMDFNLSGTGADSAMPLPSSANPAALSSLASHSAGSASVAAGTVIPATGAVPVQGPVIARDQDSESDSDSSLQLPTPASEYETHPGRLRLASAIDEAFTIHQRAPMTISRLCLYIKTNHAELAGRAVQEGEKGNRRLRAKVSSRLHKHMRFYGSRLNEKKKISEWRVNTTVPLNRLHPPRQTTNIRHYVRMLSD